MTRQVTLRLPNETHRRLKAVAERERRSLHAQVLIYIDQGLSNTQKAQDREDSA